MKIYWENILEGKGIIFVFAETSVDIRKSVNNGHLPYHSCAKHFDTIIMLDAAYEFLRAVRMRRNN